MTTVTSYFKKDEPKHQKNKRGVSPAKLKKVYAEVIARDETCQNPFCENGWPLDIPHHVVFRSQSGSDSKENLILLCCRCHRLIHHEGKLKVAGIYPGWTFTEI